MKERSYASRKKESAARLFCSSYYEKEEFPPENGKNREKRREMSPRFSVPVCEQEYIQMKFRLYASTPNRMNA